MDTWKKWIVIAVLCLPAIGAAQGLPKVAPADLSKLKPSDFTDEELDLPFYLAHFHRVANAVVETGENRGFIDIVVWRSPRDNKPYNARIMESCLSLVYFFCTKRPWNPYYGDPALRARLEAALDFWCRIQNDDGRFSEYAPGQWGLAPTAFATKFMSEALVLLHNGPQINPTIHKKVIEGVRKALIAAFTRSDLYEHGSRYTNQYTNAFAGALAFLSIHPDAEVERLLKEKLEQTHSVFQSPAGYFYELDGADWGYNLSTHHSNLLMAARYSEKLPLQKFFLQEEERYVEWLSYNAVPEPGGSTYVLNQAIETRQRRSSISLLGLYLPQEAFLSEEVPLSRAFMQSRQEVQQAIAERRKRLEAVWPNMGDLGAGEFSAFSPYVFLNRKHTRWFPTESQRQAAIASLPYIKSERFTHQRVDSRKPVQFTYVRRPGYYAAFNSGVIVSQQQRYGLGLIWVPQAGAVLQSQSSSSAAAWGTKAQGRPLVYEAASIDAQWSIDGKTVASQAGNRDIPEGVAAVSYRLGEKGTKQVVFRESQIAVTVTHEGLFTEYVPLLIARDDEVKIESGQALLRGPARQIIIAFGPDVPAAMTDATGTVAGKRISVLSLTATGELAYSIQFTAAR